MKKFLVSYFIFCFSFFIFFASGFVDSQDGLQYLAVARRIYYDQTIEMPEANYSDRSNIHFNTIKAENGKIYAPTGIGYTLALLPAVALEDVFLKISRTEHLKAFPLQSDWPVLLFASMTNSMFGALFVVSFYYFLRLLGIKHRKSFFLSFILSVSSNILIYSKHTFAHMMFVSFMFITFLFFKKYSIEKKKINLLYSGLAFGVMLISYNSTYLFTLPALGVYYIILNTKNIKTLLVNFPSHVLNGLIFIIGALPFYLLNSYITTVTKSAWVSHQLTSTLSWLKPYVFMEGFWGILFSPGKSLFLYTPILLVLLIFWYKLNWVKFKAEMLAAITLFLTYLLFIGTLMGKEDFLIWHGDSSFGNRYMLATIPFLLLLIALIYTKLTKKVKLFVFYPILFISFLVQIIGVSQPYQIRFAGLQTDANFNGRNFNVYEYGNIIPRYSPLLSMSKKFVRKVLDKKVLLNTDANQLKFFDGFGYPFGAPGNIWRSVEDFALIKVPENKKIALKVINHRIIPESSFSAILNVKNGDNTFDDIIPAGEEKIIELNSFSYEIQLEKTFAGTTSAVTNKEQVMFITQAWVDNINQNLNTLDYPYVSQVSKSLSDINYYYWGNINTDPWSIWHMHSGVYEKTFDFWWLRPFQYWDLPKSFYLILFMSNIYLFVYFGYKAIKIKID
jgi:hypothetical protein